MKKLMLSTAIALTAFSSAAIADHDDILFQGVIQSVDEANGTFVILEDETNKEVTFKTNPKTDFEKKKKEGVLDFNEDVPFSYMQKGDWVSVEVNKPKHHKGKDKDWEKGKDRGNGKSWDKPMADNAAADTTPAAPIYFVAKEVEIYR